MALKIKRDAWCRLAAKRKRAFKQIAEQLGKEHPIVILMGSLAWGRHGAEFGPDGGLQDYVREVGFLDGVFDVLNRWARDNDSAAQRDVLSIYPRGFRP